LRAPNSHRRRERTCPAGGPQRHRDTERNAPRRRPEFGRRPAPEARREHKHYWISRLAFASRFRRGQPPCGRGAL